MNVLIAMPAPRLPEVAGDATSRAAWPQLPGLEVLLHAGRRTMALDWRTAVQLALGAGLAPVAPIAIAAVTATDIAPPAAACFVTPLHVVAGLSRVHLPPGGVLRLEPAEAAQWRDAFNAEIGNDTTRLHAAADGTRWLLEAPFAEGARDPEPTLLSGEALERAAAETPDARAVRRLGAEVEIWLASHPLNRQRQRRGEAEINALWLWGGGRVMAVPSLPSRVALASTTAGDAWLAGLAAVLARPVHAVTGWADLLRHTDAQAPTSALAAVAVLAPDEAGAAGPHWQLLEEQWFVPAARALRDGQVTGVQLQIGAVTWHVARPSAWSWLKRRRAWPLLIGAGT